MQVFANDGARVDVRVDGRNGAPIVLIAGFPLTREIWNATAQTLSQTHRIVLPELRGIGQSSVSDGPYLMEVLASDVAAALDALGIERAAIVGHSLGGYVALAFSRMFTERVSHLGLICSRLAADTPQKAAQRNELADKLEADGAKALTSAYAPLLMGRQTPDAVRTLVCAMMDDFNPQAAAALLRGMALRAPADDLAPELHIAVLVVAGALDATITPHEAQAVACGFQRGRLVVCEDSGHLPMLEQPERVAAAIAELVSE